MPLHHPSLPHPYAFYTPPELANFDPLYLRGEASYVETDSAVELVSMRSIDFVRPVNITRAPAFLVFFLRVPVEWGGSGGSPPERKIEVCKLPESSFPPLFPPYPRMGRRVGIPHFWVWVGWVGGRVVYVGGFWRSPGRGSRRGLARQGISPAGVRSIRIESILLPLFFFLLSPFLSSPLLSLSHTPPHILPSSPFRPKKGPPLHSPSFSPPPKLFVLHHPIPDVVFLTVDSFTMSARWIVRPPLLIPWFHREWIGPSLMVGGGSISMEREEGG